MKTIEQHRLDAFSRIEAHTTDEKERLRLKKAAMETIATIYKVQETRKHLDYDLIHKKKYSDIVSKGINK